MNRRGFLTALAAAAAVAAVDRPSFADLMNAGATLSVDLTAKGMPISPDFLGFSYETSLMTKPDFLSLDNYSLLALYALLGANGVIRVGGNSSEFGIWNPTAPPTLQPKQYVLLPEDVKRTAEFVKATNWKCIYGLNLGNGNPYEAADQAAFAAAAFGEKLIAFQIGNEPDLYHSNGLRPPTYTVDDYVAEWKAYVEAVRAKVPSARFAGPDTANSIAWVTALANAVGHDLVLLSNHYYSEGPGSSPNSTIEKMLGSSPKLDKMLTDMATEAQRSGLPFRITEGNSVYGGGRKGVSDTQSAAIWALESMLQTASAGGLGWNFHGGTGGAYSPVHVIDGHAASTAVFYAMLMFAELTKGWSGGPEIIPASLINAPDTFVAYVVKDRLGPHPPFATPLSILLINSSPASAAVLTVNAGNGYFDSNTSVWRLEAPSYDSVGDTGLGGAAINEKNAWSAVTQEGVVFNGAAFPITVPADSAALIRLQ